MSAFGGKADVFQGVAECLLIARSGHQGEDEKSGIFPERATKDSSLPYKPLLKLWVNFAIIPVLDHVIREETNGCVEVNSPFRCLLIRNTFVCGEFFILEAMEMATQQENPDKGLLMIGAVAGGVMLLVLLATFFDFI